VQRTSVRECAYASAASGVNWASAFCLSRAGAVGPWGSRPESIESKGWVGSVEKDEICIESPDFIIGRRKDSLTKRVDECRKLNAN
jgi:hypothetical protein